MKEVKRITANPPSGKIELRLTALDDGASVFAVYQAPSKIQGRRFNKTKKYRTLEDNISRACRYFRMIDTETFFSQNAQNSLKEIY